MATMVSEREVRIEVIGPRKPLTWDIPEDGEEDDKEPEGFVRVYKTTEETTEVTGFRYQRCGGGRRVIKKTGGG